MEYSLTSEDRTVLKKQRDLRGWELEQMGPTGSNVPGEIRKTYILPIGDK